MVVKAMPSQLHERVTRAVEYALIKVLQPFMPNDSENELDMLGGSSNLPPFLSCNLLVSELALENFRGEVDGVSVFQE